VRQSQALANGSVRSHGEIIADVPDFDEEDIHHGLACAAALAKDELYPLRARVDAVPG
jgi:hypothetical protein